jgi:hypothetical protein
LLAVGDVNKDGRADFVAMSPKSGAASQLVLGQANVNADWTQVAWDANVALGDVNGDGFADTISSRGTLRFGTTSGKLDSPSSVSFRHDTSRVHTEIEHAFVSIGDPNNDGMADFVVRESARDFDVNAGASVYYDTYMLVFGRETWPTFGTHRDLASIVMASVVRNDAKNTGQRLLDGLHGAGDVNGDGIDDVLVYCYVQSKPYVWLGSTKFGEGVGSFPGLCATLAASPGLEVPARLSFASTSTGGTYVTPSRDFDINGDGNLNLLSIIIIIIIVIDDGVNRRSERLCRKLHCCSWQQTASRHATHQTENVSVVLLERIASSDRNADQRFQQRWRRRLCDRDVRLWFQRWAGGGRRVWTQEWRATSIRLCSGFSESQRDRRQERRGVCVDHRHEQCRRGVGRLRWRRYCRSNAIVSRVVAESRHGASHDRHQRPSSRHLRRNSDYRGADA